MAYGAVHVLGSVVLSQELELDVLRVSEWAAALCQIEHWSWVFVVVQERSHVDHDCVASLEQQLLMPIQLMATFELFQCNPYWWPHIAGRLGVWERVTAVTVVTPARCSHLSLHVMFQRLWLKCVWGGFLRVFWKLNTNLESKGVFERVLV